MDSDIDMRDFYYRFLLFSNFFEFSYLGIFYLKGSLCSKTFIFIYVHSRNICIVYIQTALICVIYCLFGTLDVYKIHRFCQETFCIKREAARRQNIIQIVFIQVSTYPNKKTITMFKFVSVHQLVVDCLEFKKKKSKKYFLKVFPSENKMK